MELTVLPHHDELIERCKKGEAAGYKELYQRYAKAIIYRPFVFSVKLFL